MIDTLSQHCDIEREMFIERIGYICVLILFQSLFLLLFDMRDIISSYFFQNQMFIAALH